MTEPLTLPIACCPGCGEVAADPAPRLPGPLSCPRCWLMFSYDPDEPAPVARVDIQPGQLWGPRSFPARVVGLPDGRKVLGMNLQTGEWALVKSQPAEKTAAALGTLGLGDGATLHVVADPAFTDDPEHPMIRIIVRRRSGIVERLFSESYFQAHFQLVAEAP